MSLSLTCLHCRTPFTSAVKAANFAGDVIGETKEQALGRMWADLGKHLEQEHPEIYAHDMAMSSALMGLLVSGSFETDDAEITAMRLKNAATMHRLTRRPLLDPDIRRIVEKAASGNGQINVQRVIDLLRQMRDWMDYQDVVSEAKAA